MLFLGIISWKGVLCFNGGGFVFLMGGFIFKWGMCPMRRALVLMGEFSKKSIGWGGHSLHAPLHYGKPWHILQICKWSNNTQKHPTKIATLQKLKVAISIESFNYKQKMMVKLHFVNCCFIYWGIPNNILLFSTEQVSLMPLYYVQDVYNKNQLGTKLRDMVPGVYITSWKASVLSINRLRGLGAIWASQQGL